jgi:DNA-binding HxlR family transcriptional regulator
MVVAADRAGAFRSSRRFDHFRASPGPARSVPAARLAKLTEHGVLERRAYSQHPPRYEYQLTEKGRALFPVIATLIRWGDQWAPAPAGPPVQFAHDTCDNITTPELTCPRCHGEVSAASTHSQPGPGARAHAEARRRDRCRRLAAAGRERR